MQNAKKKVTLQKQNVMIMLAAQRREKIIEMLREDGHVKVVELRSLFDVSEVTIRQDLDSLEKDGVLKRVYGGAVLTDAGSNVRGLTLLNNNNMVAKQAIAREAVKLIHDGDTIILDSGSTTTEIAKLITGFKNLTVLTNALNIAMILGTQSEIELAVTGGEFKSPTLSLTGQKAADFFNGLHADKLFLATAGINIHSGLTYPSMSDLVVKRAMIDVSDTVYLVADSTKIGKSSFATLGPLSMADTIITDNGISEVDKQLFEANNVKFIEAN